MQIPESQFPTRPVAEVVGADMLAAFSGIVSGNAGIVKRGSLSLHDSIDNAVMLTDSRELTVEQVLQMRCILTASESYWVGYPIYRRLPPKAGFLFRFQSTSQSVDVAVDLQNPGWRIDVGGQTYWAFTFAGGMLRKIARELFPEFASPSKNATWKKGSLPTHRTAAK